VPDGNLLIPQKREGRPVRLPFPVIAHHHSFT
jgi:hypothetical protein